jgi:tRNA-dihydrouridine synthase
MRQVTAADRATFLFDYIGLLLQDHDEERAGFRHQVSGQPADLTTARPARSRERWVINKVRALCTWYTKGFDNGSHLRIAVNAAESIQAVRDTIEQFFVVASDLPHGGTAVAWPQRQLDVPVPAGR